MGATSQVLCKLFSSGATPILPQIFVYIRVIHTIHHGDAAHHREIAHSGSRVFFIAQPFMGRIGKIWGSLIHI